MASLAEIRQQYPQYSDMSDADLASALHTKFYADMPRADFDQKIGFQPPSVMGDVARSVGSGLAGLPGGIAGLPRALGSGIDWALNFLPNPNSPENVAAARGAAPNILPTTQGVNQAVEENITGPAGLPGPSFQPQTTPGKYAKTAAEFALGAALPGGLVRRALNVVAPAVGSEAAGQATEGTPYEPFARVGGAIAGGMLPVRATRAITPNPIPPSRQQAVDTLRSEGVTDITAGQATGNRSLQWLESALGDMPLAGKGVQARDVAAKEQFTRAALKRVGEDAPRATPEVIDRAFTRIGNEFDTLAARHAMAFDNRLAADLGKVGREYSSLVPDAAQANIIRDTIFDLINRSRGGTPLTGDAYNSFRSRMERLARGTTDPQLGQALRGIRTAVDDAMERAIRKSSTPGDAKAWKEARRQYRDMLALEKAAVAGGADAAGGLVSPAQLREATKVTHGRRAYARGKGDFAGLARAGSEVMTPLPQSGTAPRSFAQNIGPTLATMGGIGGATGGATGAGLGLLGGMAALAAPSVSGRLLMSPAVQAYLRNQRITPMTPIPGQKTAHGLLALPTLY